MKRLSRVITLILLFCLLFIPTQTKAANTVTLTRWQRSDSLKKANNFKTLKKGKTYKLTCENQYGGFVTFKAPKKGTYTITVSNYKTKKKLASGQGEMELSLYNDECFKKMKKDKDSVWQIDFDKLMQEDRSVNGGALTIVSSEKYKSELAKYNTKKKEIESDYTGDQSTWDEETREEYKSDMEFLDILYTVHDTKGSGKVKLSKGEKIYIRICPFGDDAKKGASCTVKIK